MRSKLVVWSGVILLISSACAYVYGLASERSRSWQPLILPVSLIQGEIRSQQLGPDLSGPYEIDVDFEQGTNLDKAECLEGNVRFDPGRCKGTSDLIDISWQLFEGTNLIQHGESADNPSIEFSYPRVERRIGRFSAQRGHDYVLALNVRRDASELDITHPRIKVKVPRDVSKDNAAGVEVEKLLATTLGILGALMIAPSLVRQFKRRRAP
jgi:hypothetical protein